MSLNRVSNPRKLRQLSRAVGERVVRAYARWFDDHTLLVFGESGKQWTAVRRGTGYHVEPYDHDPPLRLTDSGVTYRAQDRADRVSAVPPPMSTSPDDETSMADHECRYPHR